MERGVLAGKVERPELGDEVVVASESVLVMQYQKAGRCGCVPASLGFGQEWVKIVRLCPAHGHVVHAPPPEFRIRTRSFPPRPVLDLI